MMMMSYVLMVQQLLPRYRQICMGKLIYPQDSARAQKTCDVTDILPCIQLRQMSTDFQIYFRYKQSIKFVTKVNYNTA